MKLVDIVGDNLPALFVSVLDVTANFLVDLGGDVLRVVSLIVEIAP